MENDTKPADYFCQRDTLNEVFEYVKNKQYNSSRINEILCSDSGKRFVSDVYESLDLKNFENIVSNVFAFTRSFS